MNINEFIEKDSLRYGFLKDFYKLGASVEVCREDACYLYLEKYGLVYAAGEFVDTPCLKNCNLICTSSPAISNECVKRGITNPPMEVYTGYYLKDEIEVKEVEGFTIRYLTMNDMDYVLEHYDNPCNSYDHIKQRIEMGMLGLVHEDHLVGFIGEHEEGTMGYLFIQEDYRKRGLAYYLEGALIQELLKKGRLPYCHVLVDNTPSLKLQTKLGLTFAKEPYYWLGKDGLK